MSPPIRRPGSAEAQHKAPCALHPPLLVAALTRCRDKLHHVGLYEVTGFVFCTRHGTSRTLSSLRQPSRAVRQRRLVATGGPTNFVFVSPLRVELIDLVKVPDKAGHVSATRGYR